MLRFLIALFFIESVEFVKYFNDEMKIKTFVSNLVLFEICLTIRENGHE